MSNEVFWSIIGGSASVTIGWFLNEISQLFRSGAENRRIKKRVLHDLLEINFTLSRLDVSSYLEQYFQFIEQEIAREKMPDSEREIIKTYLEQMIIGNFEDDVIDDLDEIDDTFYEAVIELSKVDPIRAYYLRDKTRILHNIDRIEEYLGNVKMQTQELESDVDLGNIIKPKEMNSFKEEIVNLRDDTIELAGSIGIRTKKKVKEIIYRPIVELDEERKDMIRNLFEKLNG